MSARTPASRLQGWALMILSCCCFPAAPSSLSSSPAAHSGEPLPCRRLRASLPSTLAARSCAVLAGAGCQASAQAGPASCGLESSRAVCCVHSPLGGELGSRVLLLLGGSESTHTALDCTAALRGAPWPFPSGFWRRVQEWKTKQPACPTLVLLLDQQQIRPRTEPAKTKSRRHADPPPCSTCSL